MSDLYNQIADDRSALEKLLAKIPGFQGYLDRAYRRTADRMLRDHLADQLEQRIRRLSQLEKMLLDNNGLMFMSETASAKLKLQTYRDRIKAVASGYSTFFEAIEIGEEELQSLYNFDELQMQYVDKFSAALDTLQTAITSQQGVGEAIAALDALTMEANEAFSKRETVLTNLGKGA